MPIFGNKFSPKKTPTRKAGSHNVSNDVNLEELVLENRVVSLQLGKHVMKFEDGVWIPESGKDASLHKSNKKLRKRISELQEENNLLKLKSEILLNLRNTLSLVMCSKLPLVIILGATGSGKTKLSLELARKFGGEIIGADSMQVYKGLDVITAKVTKEEQMLAPHHLIDILDPVNNYTVLEYRNEAMNIINKLVSLNKLPIVVGGTNYYIESILWNILIDQPCQTLKVKPWESSNLDNELSNAELYDKLTLLDPKMARRLHPNNRRKILRSLEVLHQKGRRHSDILDEQHSCIGGSKTSGALRYPDSLILWLQCEKNTLNARLNERVDKMIDDGLIDELLTFHKNFKDPDFTKGIFQSIGFKEFHSYLILEEKDRNSETGIVKFKECTELLKMATRRYARKQLRWIKNRFLGRTDRDVPPVYGLDTTDVLKWTENVSLKASSIVESYIQGNTCPFERLPKEDINSNSNAEDETYTCDVCDRIFIGSFQWKCHLRSNKHKTVAERKKKSVNVNNT